MKHISILGSLLAVFFTLAYGCGGDLGDSCGEAGNTDECPDGICGNTKDHQLECQQLCDEGKDCPSGYECKDVEGSHLKGCRVK